MGALLYGRYHICQRDLDGHTAGKDSRTLEIRDTTDAVRVQTWGEDLSFVTAKPRVYRSVTVRTSRLQK
jgi:hypothetical protein